MEVFFFVLSATIVFKDTIRMIASMWGKSVQVPCPIFHLVGWTFSNTYISTPAIMYQVYFWAMHVGLFAV
jgi:hypothetical protein